MEKLCRARSRHDWFIPKMEIRLLQLPNQMDLYTTSNPLMVVNRIYTFYTVRLSHYMVTASIRTALSSMRVTTVILDTGSRYSIIRRSASPLVLERHVYLNYEIFPEEGASRNLLRIFLVVVLCIRFNSDLHETIFLVADYFTVDVLIDTRFRNIYDHYIHCIDVQMELTKWQDTTSRERSGCTYYKKIEIYWRYLQRANYSHAN